MNYKISKEAVNDLEQIWIYSLETWSTEQADRYINLIIQEIEYIAQKPLSGKNYDHIRKNYLRSKVKSHLIFYRINKKEQAIEIIRVLHQKMDVDLKLED